METGFDSQTGITPLKPINDAQTEGSLVDVAELVYALGLGSSGAIHGGSSPLIDIGVKPKHKNGELAQLVVRLICIQEVRSSSLLFSTLQKLKNLILYKVFKRMRILFLRTGVRFPTSPFQGDVLVSTGLCGLIC